MREELHFYGRVQGVGFRYTAKWLASSLDLTGWVKNEWDGSVLMELQGSSASIDSFLKRLNADDYIRIERIETRELPEDAEEKSFRVRY